MSRFRRVVRIWFTRAVIAAIVLLMTSPFLVVSFQLADEYGLLPVLRPTLSGRHQEIIDRLELGDVKSFFDLPHYPGRVIPASEMDRPRRGAAYYLYFRKADSMDRDLLVIVGPEFQLLDYFHYDKD